MNPAAVSTPPAFVSVFDRVHDTVVFGAGLLGYAAALARSRNGDSVLLIEATGDLLWEATRALENGASVSNAGSEWSEWLGRLHALGGVADGFFDVALAEILTADELCSASAPFQTLLYATPIAIEREGDEMTSVTVATKSGPRLVRARSWIDTTERAQVAGIANPAVVLREPVATYRSCVLQSVAPGNLDEALHALRKNHPELECVRSARKGERRLRWPVENAGDAWHEKVPALIGELRGLAGGESSATFLMSHCAMRDYPVYGQCAEKSAEGLPRNLLVGAPALRGEALVSLAQRFELGVKLGATRSPATAIASCVGAAMLPDGMQGGDSHDVVVAGAGTAGALAAIAAARTGARTLVFDAAPYPGGIGTGAGICGYFHGAKGGLQDEVDERARELTSLFAGGPAGLALWHHEAKKIALLEMFETAGAVFEPDALLAGVERSEEGRVAAVLIVVNGKVVRVSARAFVDCTGDGDLAAMAGARSVTGREGDDRTLAYSQSVFSLTEHADRVSMRACNFDAGWVDPTDPEDLSRARLAGIAQHLATLSKVTDRPLAVAPLLGLRQSRQIETDARVTMDDLVRRGRFDDSIGEVETVADTHSVDFEFESDELAFYYWACRGFRHLLRSELPYRMLLPRGLENVFVACRASGISVDAAYGLRMQREMQRLGEAAGVAAACLAGDSTPGASSRTIDFDALRKALRRTGAIHRESENLPASKDSELLAKLDDGAPGVHLWWLFKDREAFESEVTARIHSGNTRTRFFATALLAMWENPCAEERLIASVSEREAGPTPGEFPVTGAFAQCIDLPFWLQAIILLRRVGSVRCVPVLREVVAEGKIPFNVRTIVALTLARIAEREAGTGGLNSDASHTLRTALDGLLAGDLSDAILPPSRSLWRTLHGESQRPLSNDRGADVAQDHLWQLHLIIDRARKTLGLPSLPEADGFARDPRAFVRRAFARNAASGR